MTGGKGAATHGRKGFVERHALVLALLLILAGVLARATLLRFGGFYESDVYFHYIVMKEAIAGNFLVPNVNPLSNHNGAVFEAKGFYYLTLLPYYLVRDQVTLYNFLRAVPLLYVIPQFILFYTFAGQLIKDKKFRLMALFLLVFSIANMSRTSALTYRGDGFVGIFLMASLILCAYAYKSKRHVLVYALASAVLLSICNLVWNGGEFAFVAVSLALVLITVYNFIGYRKDAIRRSLVLSASLFVYLALVSLYQLLGLIKYQSLLGLNLLWAVFAVNAMVLLFYLSADRLDAKQKRVLVWVIMLLGVVTLALVLNRYTSTASFYSVFQNNGGSAIAHYVVIELQSPPAGYIIAGEGVVSALTPLFYPLFLSTLLGLAYKWIAFLLIIPVALIYMKASVKNKSDESKDFKIIVLSYFLVAAFLLTYAERFTMVMSIPAALLEAYTLYWFLANFRMKRLAAALVICILLLQLITVVAYSVSLRPVNSVNGQFLQAAEWMNSNIPANATIITFWPFGSQIEFYANRTVTEDSVANQFTSNVYERWLMNTSTNVAPLYRLNASYLYFRYEMLNDTESICIEAEIYNCTYSHLNSTETNMKRIADNQTIPGLELVYSNNDTRLFRLTSG